MNSTRLILSHISAVELQLQRHPASKNQSRSYRSPDSNATAKLIKTQLGPLQSKASFSDSVLPDSAGFEGGIHHTTICTHTMHMTFNGLTVHRLLLFRGEGRRGTLGSSPAAAASVPVVQEDVELKRFVRTIHTIHERTSTTNLLCQVSRHQGSGRKGTAMSPVGGPGTARKKRCWSAANPLVGRRSKRSWQ